MPMYPDQEYYDPRGIPTSVRKIPIRDMDTPHYWLLLKINDDGYNYYADEIGNPGLGVPPPPSPPSGVWYFARGLRNRSPDNESDLLKALYIGATGSPEGAEPILDGTFMRMQSVRDTVRKWKEEHNFAPYSDEGNHLVAYNLNRLREANFEDNELTELSLLALAKFYNEVNAPEKMRIYIGEITRDLTEGGKLPEYSIIERSGSRVSVTSPLPEFRFR